MGPIAFRFRAELRRGWRSVLGIAVLIGLFGGAVLGSFAAARRTGSIPHRLEHFADEADVYIPLFVGGPLALRPGSGDGRTTLQAIVDAVPETQAVIEIRQLRVMTELAAFAGLDPRFGERYQKPIVLDGRPADPDAVNEATVNPVAVQRFGYRVGDQVEVPFAPPGASSEAGSFAFDPDASDPAGAPRVHRFTITGILSGGGDLVAAAEPQVQLSPAFLRAHPELSYDALLMVWLENGDADLPAFREHLGAATGDQPVFLVEARVDRGQLQRSFDLQAGALFALATALAITAILVIGQLIARQVFLDSVDMPTLAALGFSRSQLVALGFARLGLAALPGAALAVATAAVSTLFTPLGLGRLAEPERGLRLDPLALGVGGLALVLACLAAGAWPVVRSARVELARLRAQLAPVRSRIADRLARIFREPVLSVGARFALETGRGARAVPVRATLAGITFATAALIAAVTVSSSVDHLLGTPRLYGWNWDAQVDVGENEAIHPRIAEFEGLREVAIGSEFLPLSVEGEPIVGMSFQPLLGAVEPVVLEGRVARRDDEIMLGRVILERIGTRIGDEVRVGVQGTAIARPMTVVGTLVFPRVDDSASMGEGAAVTTEAITALFPPAPPPANAFVRFDPETRAETLAALRAEFGEEEVALPEPPRAVLDFGQVSEMPTILATILALLAAGTLAHGLVTTIRRRRHDLALLRCLGFVRGQLRATVASQATLTALVSILIAIPLGVLFGRWLWAVIADEAGFAVEPAIPLSALVLSVPGAVLLANVVASVPARSASRTEPALVLRAE